MICPVDRCTTTTPKNPWSPSDSTMAPTSPSRGFFGCGVIASTATSSAAPPMTAGVGGLAMSDIMHDAKRLGQCASHIYSRSEPSVATVRALGKRSSMLVQKSSFVTFSSRWACAFSRSPHSLTIVTIGLVSRCFCATYRPCGVARRIAESVSSHKTAPFPGRKYRERARTNARSIASLGSFA